MKWLLAPLLALLPMPLLPVPLMAGTVRQTGDWLLVCDNRADCTITGVPLPAAMPDYPRAQVTIWRRNRGGSQLLIAMRLIEEDGTPSGFAGEVDGLGLGHTPLEGAMATLRVDPTINSPYGHVLVPETAGAVIGVIADEGPSRLLHGFGAYGAMPLGDLADLLQRMDRAQPHVADLPDPVIEDLPQPRYNLFPRDQVDGPLVHPVFDRACAGTPYSHARGYALDHTTVPTLLVLLSCGGRDFVYTWYPSGSAPPRPLTLPREREARYRRTSASFDTDLGVLILTDHPVLATDCGARHSYGWVDGQGWILLTTQVMPRCGTALLPESWPVLFRQESWGPG
jgi:hypothetical protein